VSNTFTEPDYFDVKTLLQPPAKEETPKQEEETDPWVRVGEYEKPGSAADSSRPWNETTEIVIRHTYDNEWEGTVELLTREKATGETKQVAKGYFGAYDGLAFFINKILSDTRFMYGQFYWDGAGDANYYLYDSDVGESICVASGDLDELCDLGGGRYLWCGGNLNGIPEHALYLIDVRKFDAGDKDARRTLFSWGGHYSGRISHISSDKRFLHVDLYSHSGGKSYRGIYDVDSGEQVALFELPDGRLEIKVLIADDLEYMCLPAFYYDNPDARDFYIFRYDRSKQ